MKKIIVLIVAVGLIIELFVLANYFFNSDVSNPNQTNQFNIPKDSLVFETKKDSAVVSTKKIESKNQTITEKKNQSNKENNEFRIDAFYQYNSLSSTHEKIKYFEANILDKDSEFCNNGHEKKKMYLNILKETYNNLSNILNEGNSGNIISFCNLSNDIEFKMNKYNCKMDKETQRKIKLKCAQ